MRYLLLLTACCIACLPGNTQNANVTIGTTYGANLKIRFGNVQYSLQDPSATWQGLKPGTYDLTIYQLQKKAVGSEYVKVFDNKITLTADKHLEIMVMRYGKMVWDEGWIEKDDWNQSTYNPNGNQQSSGQAMDDAQFQKVKKTITDASSFDKMNTAKAVFRNNLFTTAQVRQLMDQFTSFNILDFLKFAYDFTVDKGNYFSLADDISSSFTKNSFMDFLRTK